METLKETTTTTVAGSTTSTAAKVTPAAKTTLLILSCILLFIGHCGGPLIMRLYFLHGGRRVWLSSVLETAGWPFIAIILAVLYLHRRATNTQNQTTFIHMRPRLFFAAAVIGVLTGADDYIYAYGVARLPVSTVALIIASQLAFTAVFAHLLVKQKFTPYSVNAVVLLTVGAAVLALHTNGDRPAGESKCEYVTGFVMTVAAAALYGFVLPLVELTYKKAKQEITYTLVLEIQMVMCLFATLFSTKGMIVNNDFKEQKEAESFSYRFEAVWYDICMPLYTSVEERGENEFVAQKRQEHQTRSYRLQLSNSLYYTDHPTVQTTLPYKPLYHTALTIKYPLSPSWTKAYSSIPILIIFDPTILSFDYSQSPKTQSTFTHPHLIKECQIFQDD